MAQHVFIRILLYVDVKFTFVLFFACTMSVLEFNYPSSIQTLRDEIGSVGGRRRNSFLGQNKVCCQEDFSKEMVP